MKETSTASFQNLIENILSKGFFDNNSISVVSMCLGFRDKK